MSNPPSKYQLRKAKFEKTMAACNGFVDPSLTYSKFRTSKRRPQNRRLTQASSNEAQETQSQEQQKAQPLAAVYNQFRMAADGIDPNVIMIPESQALSGDEQEKSDNSSTSSQTPDYSQSLSNIFEDSQPEINDGRSDCTTDCELEFSNEWKYQAPNKLISEVSEMYTKFKLPQAAVMRIFKLATDINSGQLPMKAWDVPKNFTSFKNSLAVERQFQISCYSKCMDCEDDVWNSFLIQKGNTNRSQHCLAGHLKKRTGIQFHFVKIRDLFGKLLPFIHPRLDLDSCKSKALEMLNAKVNLQPDDVVLQIYTDGFPVFKSSNAATWPFLSSFVGASRRLKKKNGTVLHGIYRAKKFDRNDMCKMVSVVLKDIMKTMEKPICWQDRTGKIRRTRVFVLNFVADSPGRADVMNMSHHCGSFGCNYCYQEQAGHYYDLQHGVERRSHESYRTDSLLGTSNNPYRGQKGPSPLEVLPYFDVILGCPPDPMHSVFIGVTKLLLEATFTGRYHKASFHIKKAQQHHIDQDLSNLQLPQRIARKPEKVGSCLTWKSSEYYLWTLYLGPILLKDRLDLAAYEVFVTFAHAISLLVSSDLTHGKLELAKVTLQVFVQDFHRVYTEENVGESLRRFNIHLMEHLAEFVELYGQLYNFDMTTFENKIGQIKKYVTGSQFSIQQMLQKYLISLMCNDPTETPVTMLNSITKPFELRGPFDESQSRHEGVRYKKLVVTSEGGRTYKSASKDAVANDACYFLGSEVIEIDHFLVQTHNAKKFYYIVGTLFKLQPFRPNDLMLYHIKSVIGQEDDVKIEIKPSIQLIPAIKVTTKETNALCFCKFLNPVDLNVE